MDEQIFRKRVNQFLKKINLKENRSPLSTLKRKDIKDSLYTKSLKAQNMESVLKERLDLVRKLK